MHNPVNFLGSYAWFHYRMASIKSLSRNFAHPSQLFNVLFVVDGNFFICQSLEMLVWLACSRVIGLVNFCRHRSFSFETVRVRTHGSRIEARIFILFLLLVG